MTMSSEADAAIVPDALAEAITIVRRDFFPRWDRQQRWRVVSCTSEDLHGAHGTADRAARTIQIIAPYAELAGPGLLALLIHEVCHAAVCDHHGREFRDRMRKAAIRARELRMDDLAELLDRDVDMYEDEGWPLTPGEVYNNLRDLVRGRWGDVGYEDAAGGIARESGLSVPELERRCRRLRRVYDEAVQHALESKKARESFREQLARESADHSEPR